MDSTYYEMFGNIRGRGHSEGTIMVAAGTWSDLARDLLGLADRLPSVLSITNSETIEFEDWMPVQYLTSRTWKPKNVKKELLAK